MGRRTAKQESKSRATPRRGASRRGLPRHGGVGYAEASTPLVRALWRGDVSLAKTYWLFGVVVGVCYAMVFAYIEYQSSGLSEGLGPAFIIALMLSYFIYAIFINIAIWRSANKYRGPKHWAILAKVMVLVSWAALIKEAWQLYSVVPN